MIEEFVSNFRACADEQGFITLRTGDRNESPDSDLIASVWNDDFLGLLIDSRQRRIESIDAVLKEIGFAAQAIEARPDAQGDTP